MRSFKSKVLSATAWALPALAAVIPANVEHDAAHASSANPLPPLDIVLQDDYAQATFSVPCPGCLGPEGTSQDDDDSILLSFKAFSEDQSCGVSNITVNGVYLPQEWHGDTASGSGSFSGVTDIQENEWFQQHNLDLEWDSTCLQAEPKPEKSAQLTTTDVAQVLTLTIKGIDGRPLTNPAGFTISYKQLSPPELLRLERTPNYSAKNVTNSESWRNPPSHLRLVPTQTQEKGENVVVIDGTETASFEDEIRELQALEAEAAELQQAIAEKKEAIRFRLKQGTKSFKEELSQCGNWTCIIKAIGDKAHGAFNVVHIILRPGHQSQPSSSEMGRPDDRYHRLGNHKQTPEPGSIHTVPLADAPEPPQSHHEVFNTPLQESRSDRKKVYIVAIEILVGVLCCGCLISVIRHRCSSLRTRTERAARKEERANARAYRRAARKLRWQNWWRRTTWKDQARIEDYEEKRALINEQESILEEAMQSEIRQLREAHGLVNCLLQAEEGRIPSPNYQHPGLPGVRTPACHCRANPPRLPLHTPSHHNTGNDSDQDHFENQPLYSPSITTTSVYTTNSGPSRPMSRSSSLPGYPSSNASTAPPAYESDEDTSDHVANGFRQYSPSITSRVSAPWTPDSSVVDVSPRPSAETLRYAESMFAETTETDVGISDEKN